MGRRHGEQLALRTLGCHVVAACSPVEAERTWATQALGVHAVHAEFDALLRDPAIDAVVVSTPTVLHAEQALAAITCGKHVFVEKPLSLDLAACERVQAAAQARPELVAMVGFVRRFDPSYAQAHGDVARGAIGKPFLVRSQTCDRNDASGEFVRFAPTSGGIFLDCSVHDIDLARWMLGGPRATRAFASGSIALHSALAAHGDVDNGYGIVEFEGGARAILYASRTMAHGHETTTEVMGTEGMLSVGIGAHRDRVQTRNAQGVSHQALEDFHERFEIAFQREMEAFVQACRGGPMPLTLADATEATRIGLALQRSLASGQPERIA